jgi:hypothetical protein
MAGKGDGGGGWGTGLGFALSDDIKPSCARQSKLCNERKKNLYHIILPASSAKLLQQCDC